MMVGRLRTLSVGLVWLALFGCDSQREKQVREVVVASPSGDLQIAVTTDDEGRLTYSVTRGGEVIVETSPMGLSSTTHDLTGGVAMSESSVRTIDESYTMRTGKRSERRVLGSEAIVPLEAADGARAELILRAHEDGVAFRYRLLGDGESEVTSESTGFAIPDGARVLTRAHEGGDLVFVPTTGEYQQPPILSAPSIVEDPSWISPGRAAWSWFSQETGTPELQSEYIDFAAEYGWDYVVIDAKWDQWDDAEQQVRDLVARAATAGVKLLLWNNSGGSHTPSPLETPLNKMIEPDRRDEMEKIASWGIAGVKVDFFNSDKQDRINQYLGILRDAADFELLVNFHGSTVPRGWQRTYPHLLTQEAVNGAEVYKFAAVQGAPDALTNVHHVLLRNTVGSIDYTPRAVSSRPCSPSSSLYALAAPNGWGFHMRTPSMNGMTQ